jgi:hypothetical protein
LLRDLNNNYLTQRTFNVHWLGVPYRRSPECFSTERTRFLDEFFGRHVADRNAFWFMWRPDVHGTFHR